MKIFNIKNVRNYKDETLYIEQFKEKELKKCIIKNKDIRKKYNIYYKKDSNKVIPLRGNLTNYQLLMLIKNVLLKSYHMFIIIDKKTKEEYRWVYNNYNKFPVFPKERIDLSLNKELIYQIDKEMNNVKQKRKNNNKIIDLYIASYFYEYMKGDNHEQTIPMLKYK